MVSIESTPEMVAAVYATMTRNLAVVRRRLDKPLTLADKLLLGHLDDPEHQELTPGDSQLAAASRPRRVSGRARADRAVAVHADPARQGRGPGHDPLRPPDPGAGRGRGGSARVAGGKQGGLRLPALGGGEIRHRLLEARRRHHPPGGARELRLPRPHDDRHRLAHPQRRRPGRLPAWAARTRWT